MVGLANGCDSLTLKTCFHRTAPIEARLWFMLTVRVSHETTKVDDEGKREMFENGGVINNRDVKR